MSDVFAVYAPDYEKVMEADHNAQLSHELLARAAVYDAAKAYERGQSKDDPAQANQLLEAYSAAFIDRIVETKGLDFVDREGAKHEARELVEQHLADGR
ncbi:DUF3759 domain-containing protein [Streptomyces sp. NPDC015346]|uniref:DUF3759 domain-containing protein n=1 Tax=Streptomyces sp. NPDC015346 TaxID=3364954 RepID=UPI0036FFF4D0